jgi:hypothetical protein
MRQTLWQPGLWSDCLLFVYALGVKEEEEEEEEKEEEESQRKEEKKKK